MRPDSGAARPVRRATVIGRWGDDTALLRTADGATVEVPVPEELRDRIDVGASVDLLEDGVVDWHVPGDQRAG
jgi:hypothetical protein